MRHDFGRICEDEEDVEDDEEEEEDDEDWNCLVDGGEVHKLLLFWLAWEWSVSKFIRFTVPMCSNA